PPPAPPPPGIDLAGPPFNFQIRLLDDKGQELEHHDVTRIMLPQEYMEATAKFEIDRANPGKNLLTVQVALIPEFFSGPPCDVELVLPPDRNPGLLETKIKEGTFKQKLIRPTSRRVFKTLSAFNLQLRDVPDQSGFVYVNVDGFQRGFIFATNFRGGSFDPLRARGLRIYAPPYAQPNPKYPVHFEVDNPPGDEVSLKFGIDRDDDGQITDDELIDLPPGYRSQHVIFNPSGPDGALVFKTEVKDWSAEIDTSGIIGRRNFGGWLVASTGGPKLEVLNSRNEKVRTVSYSETLDATGKKPPVIIFDNTPPEDIAFRDVPPGQKALVGSTLTVKATGRDPETPIKSVLFFFGDPTDDGKLPAGVMPFKGKLLPGPNPVWVAELTAFEKKGPQDISVEFINAVDLGAFATMTIDVTGPPTPAATTPAATTGKIQGTVTWGGGRFALGGLDVSLKNAKGEEKKKAKTKDDGSYLFEDVEPGEYNVSSSRAANAGTDKGNTAVTVEAGKTAKGDIDLMRRP
ncbi:MAG: carboxypeptidase regulatory-like domain-containing protein, partial [Planctomycetes bacterium]|nr:carboxypeptidase regulatory-like domain-containing protein [Planctomycetota bacterium]